MARGDGCSTFSGAALSEWREGLIIGAHRDLVSERGREPAGAAEPLLQPRLVDRLHGHLARREPWGEGRCGPLSFTRAPSEPWLENDLPEKEERDFVATARRHPWDL